MAKAINTAAAADTAVKAVVDKPAVKKIVTGFTNGTLTAAGCDIDHIVEKQIGGTSVPGATCSSWCPTRNQESGRQTYALMVAEVKRILEPNRKGVKQLQIRFKDAKVPDDVEDGSYDIETLLRSGKVVGSADVKDKGQGTPIQLVAGGAGEVIPRARVRGHADRDVGAAPHPRHEVDQLQARRREQPDQGHRHGGGGARVEADAERRQGHHPVGADRRGAGGSAGRSGGPAPRREAKATASDVRQLKLDPVKNKDLPFYYPYLSKES